MRIKRFTLAQRLFHFLLLVSFLILAATGTARMFIETRFGASLAAIFGGYEGALSVHKFFGIFLIVLFFLHLLYLVFSVRGRTIGSESLLPHPRDIGDLFRHVGWMTGLRKHPSFERWAYWEKFDYWAVFWGLFIIGGTGLMLSNPMVTSRFLPGWSLNVAFWIHRIEAILAMGHVFLIHFLIAHLRRTNFPVDPAMVTGFADLDIALEERGDWIDRLERENRLRNATVRKESGIAVRVATYAFGILTMACGFYLIIGGILNAPYVTW